ncbi:MAG: hypothetical protein IPI81_04740 [Flavobacteriales bacterium]|nr:hypothetical protein [Flavobacteriales bacterium]
MTEQKRPPALFDAYGFIVDLAVVHSGSFDVQPVPKALLEPTLADEDPARRDLEVIPGIAGHGLGVRNTKVMRRPSKWGRKLVNLRNAWAPALDTAKAVILPGGAHPFYDPARHGSVGEALTPEVRRICDELFGCAQHGWSNSQGLHLGIHFGKDSEFGKLHAAVRLLLPLIPSLAAASPILEGRVTGSSCSRLHAQLHAHERLTDLMGSFVPEPVFDREEHDRVIMAPIAQALAPHDPTGLLDPVLYNSRAATANFDRSVVTLHVIDTQESPSANMAVAEMIITVLRALVRGRWVSNYLQRAWGSDDLQQLMLGAIKEGGRMMITNRDYLLMLGLMKQESMVAAKVWQHLFVELYGDLSENARGHIGHILEHGCLADRILARTGKQPTIDGIRAAYGHLAACYAADEAYL